MGSGIIGGGSSTGMIRISELDEGMFITGASGYAAAIDFDSARVIPIGTETSPVGLPLICMLRIS